MMRLILDSTGIKFPDFPGLEDCCEYSTSGQMDFYSNDMGIKIMPKKGYSLFEMDEDGNFTRVKKAKVLLIQNIAEHEHEAEKHMRFQLGVYEPPTERTE